MNLVKFNFVVKQKHKSSHKINGSSLLQSLSSTSIASIWYLVTHAILLIYDELLVFFRTNLFIFGLSSYFKRDKIKIVHLLPEVFDFCTLGRDKYNVFHYVNNGTEQ